MQVKDGPDMSKLQESIEKTVGAHKFNCPKCGEALSMTNAAMVPERSVLHMKLESSTGAFSAKTVGGVITEFDKLLRMVAKDVGGKVHVFIDSVERTEKTLDVGFLITAVVEP